MKKSVLRAVLLLVATVMFAAACGGSEDSGAIEIEDARYRVATAELGAGYLSISNTTNSDVTLEGASAEGVGRIELHESTANDDGTMAMQARPDGFLIAAGETVVLEPGGKHLMIFEPEGTDDLTISFDFGDETIDVVTAFDAEASAATDDDHAGHGDDTDHSDDADHADHSDDDAMEDMDDEAMEDSDS